MSFSLQNLADSFLTNYQSRFFSVEEIIALMGDLPKFHDYLSRFPLELKALLAVKVGTEVEDMSSLALDCFKSIIGNRLPFYFKIGGVEAKRDMRFASQWGASCIVAPMVESVYAFELFVRKVDEILPHYKGKIAINLETITGARQLKKIVDSSLFGRISSLTIGRGDLKASLSENEDINEVIQEIIQTVRSKSNLLIGIGGFLSPKDVELFSQFQVDFLNTRHFVLGSLATSQEILQCLEFEFLIYLYLCLFDKEEDRFYQGRLPHLIERMNQS